MLLIFFVAFFLSKVRSGYFVDPPLDVRPLIIDIIDRSGRLNKIIRKIFGTFKIPDMILNIPQLIVNIQ